MYGTTSHFFFVNVALLRSSLVEQTNAIPILEILLPEIGNWCRIHASRLLFSSNISTRVPGMVVALQGEREGIPPYF